MARFRRKRHKVVLRRSHVAYQGRVWIQWFGQIVKIGLFAGSAFLAAWGVSELYRRSPGLCVQSIRVEGTTLPLSALKLPVSVGKPLFSFSTSKTRADLLTLFPQWENVTLQRGWDKSLRVKVTPRVPRAKTFFRGQWKAVDSQGVFFPLTTETTPFEGPVLEGVTPGASSQSVLRLLEALQNTNEPWTASFNKIKMSSDESVTLFLPGDIPVLWGPLTTSEKVAHIRARRLQQVLLDPTLPSGVASVRFVEDHRLVVKPKEGY